MFNLISPRKLLRFQRVKSFLAQTQGFAPSHTKRKFLSGPFRSVSNRALNVKRRFKQSITSSINTHLDKCLDYTAQLCDREQG